MAPADCAGGGGSGSRRTETGSGQVRGGVGEILGRPGDRGADGGKDADDEAAHEERGRYGEHRYGDRASRLPNLRLFGVAARFRAFRVVRLRSHSAEHAQRRTQYRASGDGGGQHEDRRQPGDVLCGGVLGNGLAQTGAERRNQGLVEEMRQQDDHSGGDLRAHGGVDDRYQASRGKAC